MEKFPETSGIASLFDHGENTPKRSVSVYPSPK